MRQFLLGGNVAYATSATSFNDVPAGAFGLFVIEDGVPVLDSDGSKVKTMANLVLGRDAKLGGPIVIPINKRGFVYNKGEYQAATKFKVVYTIPEPSVVGTYSLIAVKKGKVFNDRHKWTADVYVRNISKTADELALDLALHMNGMSKSDLKDGAIPADLETPRMLTLGLKASVAGAKLTIEALNDGEDFEIVPADELMGLQPDAEPTAGIPAYGDAAYITDLACKAAADAGFEYTFEEDIKMYPGYPLDPLAGEKKEDTGFTIFNLSFFEGREVKQVDQVVKQIVQIALPTGAAAISTLDSIFAKIGE